MRRALVAVAGLLLGACPGHGDAPAAGTGSAPGSAVGSAQEATMTTGSGSAGRPPMPEVANAGPGYLYVKGADYEGVIASAGGPWQPSPRQVAEVEVALGPAIAAHELGKAFPPATFKRQYSGGADAAGAKIIVIQLACEVDADWPEKGLPSVKGGGACYGRAEYDVATGRITRLDANSAR